jgi:simple sugar transport system permease protein
LVFWENVLSAGVASGTPLLLATLGEILAERSGVLNLGVDGMMLLGASVGFRLTWMTGSLIVGLMAALALGAIAALLHGLVTITLCSDQVVSGLGLGFFASGLAAIIGAEVVGAPGVASFGHLEMPGLARLPLLGPLFFSQNTLVYLGFILVPLCWFYLYRTRHGLMLRAVGENPTAADAQGVPVTMGGALAGLAGASLSLAITPGWVEGMTSGQGWIAVGLVIFAGWDPTRAAWGSYLFGAIRRLPLDLQGIENLPLFRDPNLGYFLDMLPYLFTIIVLIAANSGKLRRYRGAPAALGLPFIRGERGK